jgi:hypothetical protein
MKLSKKAMEYPLPTPPHSSVPNEETPACTEMKGGRGGNGNRPFREVPKWPETAQSKFILVLPAYDCVVKLCNPYITEPKIKVTPYVIII